MIIGKWQISCRALFENNISKTGLCASLMCPRQHFGRQVKRHHFTHVPSQCGSDDSGSARNVECKLRRTGAGCFDEALRQAAVRGRSRRRKTSSLTGEFLLCLLKMIHGYPVAAVMAALLSSICASSPQRQRGGSPVSQHIPI